MNEYVDQIRSRILPSTLIGRYVSLKPKPNGESSGLCPFHAEKTPSFTVNDNKGFFHCFGCHEHGDIFSFLMKIENLPYKDALSQLAREAGVTLPAYDQRQQERDAAYKIIYKIYELAATYYSHCLFAKEGEHALNYLRKRGLSFEIIKQFRLGFTPASVDELIKLYAKHNILEKQLLEAQIIRHNERGYYNIFRNRVIFPIQDRQNRVIAFGGRILGEGEPKYLNSPENPIFIKGEHLYGLNHAYKAAAKAREVLIVEGYMDVLSLADKGIGNVVAPLGTSLKPKQIESLWQIVPEPTICMDADASGKRASAKIALEIIPLLKPGHSLKICELTGGKDPDEIIMKHGKPFWQELTSKANSLADFLFAQICAEYELQTPEGQAACAERFKKISQTIQDTSLQKNYFYFFQNALRDFLWQKRKSKQTSKANNQQHSEYSLQIKQHLLPESVMNSSIVSVLMVLFCYPHLLQQDNVSERLVELEIECKTLDTMRNYLLSINDYKSIASSPLEKSVLRTKFDTMLGEENGLRRAAACAFLELQSIGDEQDIMAYLERAFKISTLGVLRKQISSAKKLLVQYPENELYFKRMAELKSHEENLKTELDLI